MKTVKVIGIYDAAGNLLRTELQPVSVKFKRKKFGTRINRLPGTKRK